MKIGIAGAGGIGSNVAVNLVRSAVSALKIIDFDRVDATNLNRQFYFHDQIGQVKVKALADNLRRIRAEVAIEAIATRLDRFNCAGIFADCPIVVEGLDGAADKKMLLESLAGGRHVIVSACGIAGADLEEVRVRRIGSCYVVGDFCSDCGELPLFAHKVLLVASRMTEIILKHRESYV